jgi:putative transposase
MNVVQQLGPELGIVATCAALGLARATFYRQQQQPMERVAERKPPARKLPPEERKAVLDALHDPRFVDRAPAEVYATLLDEGKYLCSERTMYRILDENQEVRERRNQLRHPKYTAPELLATAPNQLWSWDITKLLGPAKWTYFYLYVILDVFSRYVVGWMVAPNESMVSGTSEEGVRICLSTLPRPQHQGRPSVLPALRRPEQERGEDRR